MTQRMTRRKRISDVLKDSELDLSFYVPNGDKSKGFFVGDMLEEMGEGEEEK